MLQPLWFRFIRLREDPREYGPTHFALSGAADAHTVQAIAQRAGSQCFDCNRGPFHVLEVWVEKETMVEILPPEYMRGNILPSTGLIMSGRP